MVTLIDKMSHKIGTKSVKYEHKCKSLESKPKKNIINKHTNKQTNKQTKSIINKPHI
jgi:hypothetical protein